MKPHRSRTLFEAIFLTSTRPFSRSISVFSNMKLPGLASAAGSAIDAMNMSLVVGTLAGDDTVMVVMRDNNAAAAFCGEIRNLIS